MKQVRAVLLRRAREAAADVQAQRRGTAELGAFVRALRKTEPSQIVLCAWCGRVAAGEHWIDPAPLLEPAQRERLREKATHSICPDCFDRENAAAKAERARRR